MQRLEFQADSLIKGNTLAELLCERIRVSQSQRVSKRFQLNPDRSDEVYPNDG